MKRFIVSVLCAAVFFIGLGSLADKVGAKFKSDEQALILIKKARTAIGGDANIANVRSLSVAGKVTQNIAFDGATKTEQGDLEINMQLPNQFSKSLKFGSDGEAGIVRKETDVLVFRKEGGAPMPEILEGGDGQKNFIIRKRGEGEPITLRSDGALPDGARKIVIRKGDGSTQESETFDGKRIVVDKDLQFARGGVRHNELFRTAFALLLTAPEGADATYTYVGEADVDGNSCDIVAAQTGGESFKLYLDKSSSLPRMMTYQAVKPLVFRFNKEDAKGNIERERMDAVRKAAERIETAEYQVKFSDYRNVGGLQMPHKWTQSVGDQIDQIVDIVNYEINPANIAEKLQKSTDRVMFRMAKPQ